MEQAACQRVVRDLARGRIVMKRFPHDSSDVGELDQFGQRASDVEAREGFSVALAGFDPLAVVIDSARNGLVWLHKLLGVPKELRVPIPGIRGVDARLRSDEQRSEGAYLFAVQQLLRRPGLGPSRDRQLHRRQITTSWHMKVDACRLGITFLMYSGRLTVDLD